MLYLWLIIFSVVGNVPIDIETLLVTDFVNLKISTSLSNVLIEIEYTCICL
jgi:hypothetical protein